jgi:hypothetical protein
MIEFQDPQSMFMVVIGVLLPGLISITKKYNWSSQTTTLLTFGASAIAAAGHLFFQEGGFDVNNWPTTFLKILFITVTAYNMYWKPTGLDEKIAVNVGTGRKEARAKEARKVARTTSAKQRKATRK